MILRLLRTWALIAVAGIPLLAVLLIPEIQRSRVGAGELLVVGVALLLGLLVALTIVAPALSAVAAPAAPRWYPRTAIAEAARVWRTHRASAFGALGILMAGYVVAQAASYAVGVLVPPFHPDGEGWIFDYPAFAAQGIVAFVLITAAVTGYADRLRVLAREGTATK